MTNKQVFKSLLEMFYIWSVKVLFLLLKIFRELQTLEISNGIFFITLDYHRIDALCTLGRRLPIHLDLEVLSALGLTLSLSRIYILLHTHRLTLSISNDRFCRGFNALGSFSLIVYLPNQGQISWLTGCRTIVFRRKVTEPFIGLN